MADVFEAPFKKASSTFSASGDAQALLAAASDGTAYMIRHVKISTDAATNVDVHFGTGAATDATWFAGGELGAGGGDNDRFEPFQEVGGKNTAVVFDVGDLSNGRVTIWYQEV